MPGKTQSGREKDGGLDMASGNAASALPGLGDEAAKTAEEERWFNPLRPIAVVGLGNPEPKYARTPHNIGFLTLDELQRRWGVERRRYARFHAEIAAFKKDNRVAWIVAPLTYMNLSGEAVRPFCEYYDIPPKNTLVLCDDHDLPWGRIRLRLGGSSGGHKGLTSIQRHLGTQQFPRLRVGIRPANPLKDLAEYVLTPFWGEGLEMADLMAKIAADAVETALEKGFSHAMNHFNGLNMAEPEPKQE
ncbi:MAG: aminoacyl-tRNA hydrolase [Candidatus Sumerlaeota bacterium]|nr:aminoacyl-tRNA hydrolase [Candidatus Sumerlaeota bacterium]